MFNLFEMEILTNILLFQKVNAKILYTLITGLVNTKISPFSEEHLFTNKVYDLKQHEYISKI